MDCWHQRLSCSPSICIGVSTRCVLSYDVEFCSCGSVGRVGGVKLGCKMALVLAVCTDGGRDVGR